MKNILRLIAILCLITFVSCESGTEIAMEYQLTANVNSTTVIKDMMGANSLEFFSSDDDLELTLYSYIYDNNGGLLEEKSVVLSNFYDNATFKSSLTEGEYTVVYTVCVNDSDGDPIWSTNNKSSLYNLSYSVRDGWNEWAHVLGVTQKSVNILGSQEINIDLESVGAFATMAFSYGNSSQVAYLYVTGDKRSISYSVYDQKSNVYTASEGYIAWSDEASLSQDYSGTVMCYFFLPIDDMSITWRSYNSSLNVINSGSFSCDLIRGSNSTITTNIDTGVTTKVVAADEGNNMFEYNYNIAK